jgi:hypothetical protein
MPHPRYSGKEIVQRGQELYEQKIRAQVEPGNIGKFLVINVETGDYEMDASDIAAGQRAKAKDPQAPFFLMRIGYSAAYSIGGRSRRTAP